MVARQLMVWHHNYRLMHRRQLRHRRSARATNHQVGRREQFPHLAREFQHAKILFLGSHAFLYGNGLRHTGKKGVENIHTARWEHHRIDARG